MAIAARTTRGWAPERYAESELASNAAAPLFSIAIPSGIRPAIRMTVFHSMA